ncbi:hypothetical protein ACFL2V_14755 [Pseudomonadota bacterium]
MAYFDIKLSFLKKLSLYFYMIEGSTEKSIQPVSVDLSLGKIFKIKTERVIDIDKKMPDVQQLSLPHDLEPGEYVLAATVEKLNQKHTKYAGIVFPRSRAYRIGLSITSGIAAPHYRGELIFGIKNISTNSIRLKKGMGLIQVVFLDVRSDILPLKHTYQDGKVI